MNREDFLNPENWRGGPSYQLGMAWPPGGDRSVLRALGGLSQMPDVMGPWSSKDLFPGPADPPTALDREIGYKGYCLLRLAGGAELGCLVMGLLGEHKDESSNDWLVLAILRGMQDRAFGVVYSDHFRQDNLWLDQLDAAYLAIAEAVYDEVPFTFAVIDFEGFPLDPGLHEIISFQLSHGGLLLPPDLFARLDLSGPWITRRSGLRWLTSREA